MEYAHNYESCVGTALRKTGLARSEFFITTKYGPGDVQEEVRNSLEKEHRCQQLYHSRPRKANQERRSSSSREPGLSSLSLISLGHPT
ncbi:hypothetical protein K443DRAFT_679992, partial [Laccaria amethystina LaAM-08-1]